MSTPALVIGVDGGGTKTLAWLAPLDDGSAGTILGRGLAGPGNPRAVGFEVAQANIASAVETAFWDAKLPPTTAAAACFCLAGAGRPVEQDRIAAWAIGRHLARQVKVTGDAEPILAAASADNVGVALICGTGSLAWGRNQEGAVARCGGWGYLLGDEGSGYAIALAGLRAAMRSADGRGSQTDLLPALMKELGADSPQELVAKVYSPEMTRERLAGLASVIFDYRSTDPAAETIIQTAASDLVEMAATVAVQLRLPPRGYTLALAGGVLLCQLNYLDQIVKTLSDRAGASRSQPNRWCVVEEPVQGAVVLARQLASS